ncbi:hypothetical protein ACH4ZU_19860 [Streptomyces sp. NPDC020472]|uniref:hypothetical protein n=1 Tax=Streptomyces sp. NPDC020472 TaxID=3365075 RepID=UPI00379A6E0A
MGRPTGTRRGRGRASAVAVTVVCLAYAPIAMTELWPYARAETPWRAGPVGVMMAG